MTPGVATDHVSRELVITTGLPVIAYLAHGPADQVSEAVVGALTMAVLTQHLLAQNEVNA